MDQHKLDHYSHNRLT